MDCRYLAQGGWVLQRAPEAQQVLPRAPPWLETAHDLMYHVRNLGLQHPANYRSIVKSIQSNNATVDHNLACVFEIYRDTRPDPGLHLPHTPVRLGGVAHQHSGFQKRIEIWPFIIVHAAHLSSIRAPPPESHIMTDETSPDLCALMGSRLCHDLISPLGAIANGMELLEMTFDTPTPEMELIKQSVENVNARIKLFRISFGQAGSEQQIGRSEVAAILKDYFAPSRLTVEWHPAEDVPRTEAKAALLAVLCLEGALPMGGAIDVTRSDGRWTVAGRGPRLRIDGGGWDHLAGAGQVPEDARSVHFALLGNWSKAHSRGLVLDVSEDRVSLAF